MQPAIKWAGSKRLLAAALARLFPPGGRFFDPFVGGGAILPHVADRPGTAGDVLPELIALWEVIQRAPDQAAEGYAARWRRLQDEGEAAYYDVRARFNRERNPLDLLFLTRTCVNGLVRFNAAGEFNNSLHHTRPGIAPERLRGVLRQWSRALQRVTFQAADYRETLAAARSGDCVFLDPPYAANRGRYRPEAFDLPALFAELERLNRLGARWVLTFDGRAGDRVYEGVVPEGLYRHRLAAPTGNSPFPRLMGRGAERVTEAVYLNFEASPVVTRFHPCAQVDQTVRAVTRSD